MIRRSEYGPRCPHCGNVNPTGVIEPDTTGCACMFCKQPFNFWIEKLPFYCTDDGRGSRCDCDVCTGKVHPADEVEPGRC